MGAKGGYRILDTFNILWLISPAISTAKALNHACKRTHHAQRSCRAQRIRPVLAQPLVRPDAAAPRQEAARLLVHPKLPLARLPRRLRRRRAVAATALRLRQARYRRADAVQVHVARRRAGAARQRVGARQRLLDRRQQQARRFDGAPAAAAAAAAAWAARRHERVAPAVGRNERHELRAGGVFAFRHAELPQEHGLGRRWVRCGGGGRSAGRWTRELVDSVEALLRLLEMLAGVEQLERGVAVLHQAVGRALGARPKLDVENLRQDHAGRRWRKRLRLEV